jgi:hypothetical protein
MTAAMSPAPLCRGRLPSPTRFVLAFLLVLLATPPGLSQRAQLEPRTARADREVTPERAALALGVAPGDVRLVDLPLPIDTPEHVTLSLPLGDGPAVVTLARHDLRAAGFVVLAYLPDGTLAPVEVPPASTYRGELFHAAGALSVLGQLTPLGLQAELRGPDGTRWSLRPLAGVVPGISRAQHALVEGGVPEPDWPTCGSASPALPDDVVLPDGSPAGAPTPPPGAPTGGGTDPTVPVAPPGSLGGALGAGPGVGSGAGGTGTRVSSVDGESAPPLGCAQRAQIAFEADYEYYQLKGSSVAGTVAAIEGHMNEVDFFYQRDLRVSYELTQVVVRTAPFYVPVSGGDLLDQFRAEWNSTFASVPRDMAHLMTAKPGSLIEYGGLAWVSVVCNTGLSYGWSLDSAGIIGHEAGHNWGSGHCNDASPCNNMCGACLYIAPITKGIKEAYMAGVSCLERVFMPVTPLPPYVVSDALVVAKDEYFTALAPADVDVLKNDEDGNCGAPLLEGVDGTSDLGGALSILPGAGPKGRDLLRYTAPADLFVGLDSAGYVVGDGSGQQTPGTWSLEVRPLELSGWWPLDEGSGVDAGDLGDGLRHGTVEGGAAWSTGQHGGALELDGVDDAVALPAFDLVRPAVTMTAWVRRDGSQVDWAGIVMTRDAGSAAGLHMGTFEELRYSWEGAFDTWTWNSGLTLPDGEWAFTALVVDATQATLYLGAGGSLSSATRMDAHGLETFAGTTYIGWDPWVTNRRFAGGVDDVRVYDHALSASELADLFERGGRAHLPVPSDGGGLVDPDASLRWTPGLAALSHDLYVGGSYAAVEAATSASPEFVTNLPGSAFAPGALTVGERFYWRVDTLTAAGTITGPVWQFRVDGKGHWRLDELAGTVAADVHGLNPGTYGNGVGLDKEPATPFTGNSIRLNGSSPQQVVMAAPNLDSDRVTLTGWVRRIGDQTDWAGLVFCRGGDTVAGFNVGEANELRYHWDGSKWGWDSGLVLPDAQWAFVALVVEPDRATFWMGVEGAPLVSAVNAEGHGVEPFDSTLHLGHDPAGGRWFNGRLDDVRAFDRALSPQEVQRLYEDTLSGTL